MQQLAFVIGFAAILAGASTDVLAQTSERRPVGVTFGYPGSVGLIWNVSPRIAIRPSLTFSHASTEPAAPANPVVTSTISTSGWSVGTGVSAPITIKTWDPVRVYVAPSFVYTRSAAETQSVALLLLDVVTGTLPAVPTLTLNSTTSVREGAGLVGAEYTPHPHFGVFGEAGFGYSASTTTVTATPSALATSGSTHAHAWGSRAGVGVILYF